MTLNEIRSAVLSLADKYGITSAILFGFRANGTNRADSDVDLIVEFDRPVSLITLSALKSDLEDVLSLRVDIIHGPLTGNDMIEPGDQMLLYTA